jgi:CRISPR/Cas system-associated protein Csm6
MKGFGSFMGAAVMAGAGLAYYVYQRHQRTGVGYLDVIKQLPGEVQRASDEARRRAAEAFEQGKAAARSREADLVRQLEAAGAPSSAPAPAPGPAPESTTI